LVLILQNIVCELSCVQLSKRSGIKYYKRLNYHLCNTTASFRVKQSPLINGNLYNCKWVRNKKKIVHLFIVQIHWINIYLCYQCQTIITKVVDRFLLVSRFTQYNVIKC
jgi:hypothetical protein